MRMRILGLALVVAVTAVPAVVEAQAPGAEQRQERAVRARGGFSPVERLVERRADLGLSAEQVARLQDIEARLQQRNAPLVEQLRASGAWGERRQRAERGPRAESERRAPREAREARAERGERARGARQMPEELRPAARQLRENRRAAMEEIRAVLTDDQQASLRREAEQRRGEARGNRGSRGPRGNR